MSEYLKKKSRKPNAESDQGDSDLVWGAAAIGHVINRKPTQVYHLFETRKLGDAVIKIGHKTLLGSKERLGRLFFD